LIVQALLQAGADVNSVNVAGGNALIYAPGGCRIRHFWMVQVLLEAGADANSVNAAGDNAHIYAAGRGHF
jgi:ankyrin repeat protein